MNEYQQSFCGCCDHPSNGLCSFLFCPCLFGELYGRRRPDSNFIVHFSIGTIVSFIPGVNCFFYAKERQGLQAEGRMHVEQMSKIFWMSFCFYGCLLSQDRAQYMHAPGEPKLIWFPS
mmetsp:Transcript_3064/g.5409  ORF Transcript_3064/g.5409 Transcript_3064/m.5409 type:complete len:118 (-) Transcript_3064:278-631(-)